MQSTKYPPLHTSLYIHTLLCMEISRFPNKLKSFRRINGYSRKKIARILGHADTSTLSRWERGIVLPGLLQTFHLARVYKTLPNELFNELWSSLEKVESLLTSDDESFNSNQSLYL